LILVLIVNEVRNGAVRTFLNGSIQPSELANIVTIIYLSVWLFSKRDQLGDVGFGLFPLAAILGFLFALIFLQPDLSAAMTILFLGGMMFFLAGGELRQILIVLVVALVIGFIIVQLTATGTNRMGLYLAGLKDPTQASYHVRRSVEAFVKGKWLGVGIGMSETKLTGLPYPSTDSIFAVIGEETGILGSVALIALYVLLLWRGLTIARRAPDNLGTLLAGGLTLWIAMEAFINMAVMVNLMPFAGNALPFISSGGSNLLVSFAAVGILMNISRSSAQIRKEEGRLFSAVVDLRRRDRRRSVSGARGSSGPDFEG
ncbi:MAG TPA: FtsW/RodA/SpoVE family cell cycle protein, partial [Anaerolineales bacterium]